MRTLGRAVATLIAVLGGLVLLAAPAYAHPAPIREAGSGAGAVLPAAALPPSIAPETYSVPTAAPGLTALLVGAVVGLAVLVALLLWARRSHGVSPQRA